MWPKYMLVPFEYLFALVNAAVTAAVFLLVLYDSRPADRVTVGQDGQRR